MVRPSYRPLVQPEEKQSRRYGRTRVMDLAAEGHEERLGINKRPASTGRTRLFGDFSRKSGDDEKLSVSRRPVSNGRAAIPRQSNRVTVTISNRRALSTGRSGMYERGLEHQAKREAKIEIIRKEMMEECTFTPKTLYSFSSTSRSASKTSTTNESSEMRVLDDVYERLYRHANSDGTPIKVGRGAGSSAMHIGTSRGGTSACSSRIDELYQEGKRKLRGRLTEKQERALRQKRREQQEILECTFHPKTRWSVRVDPGKNDPGRIGISPRSPPKTRKSRRPPQEILVTSPSDIRHWTPKRNRTNTTDYIMVSPLHDPSVYEDTRSIDDSTLLPRMHCIGSTVGTSTAGSVKTQTDATEYGSI